jgi:hypothetical protein
VTLELGKYVRCSGCVTRLIDVVNRTPIDLEELVGFHRGRLAQGFYFLVLTDTLSAGDFEFFGYTYFSGGRIGLPSNDSTVDRARQSVHAGLAEIGGQQGVVGLAERFAKSVQPKGFQRYVKIVPVIGHDSTMGSADQYPASRLGITQLNLARSKPKLFLVGAKVEGSVWSLCGGEAIDVAAGARHDRSYAEDPRRKVMKFLSEL